MRSTDWISPQPKWAETMPEQKANRTRLFEPCPPDERLNPPARRKFVTTGEAAGPLRSSYNESSSATVPSRPETDAVRHLAYRPPRAAACRGRRDPPGARLLYRRDAARNAARGAKVDAVVLPVSRSPAARSDRDDVARRDRCDPSPVPDAGCRARPGEWRAHRLRRLPGAALADDVPPLALGSLARLTPVRGHSTDERDDGGKGEILNRVGSKSRIDGSLPLRWRCNTLEKRETVNGVKGENP